MDINNEIIKHLENIDNHIAEYRQKNAKDPLALILDLPHRYAIKANFLQGGNDSNIINYMGIEILKKEEVVIVDNKQRNENSRRV